VPLHAGWLQFASHPWAGPLLTLFAALPFLPFLGMPLISDDYSQIYFARLYISPDGLDGLVSDILYRSRSTSLVATRIVDALASIAQPAHLAAGLLLHALNAWLLFRLAEALGLDRAAALLAGLCFAFHSGHQEAVVWIASHHELFVFAFTALAAILWLRRLAGGGPGSALAAVGACVAALYSKESAVVVLPLLAALWWAGPDRRNRRELLWLLPVLALTLVYAYSIFQASSTHLHLNDGTFSFGAPFWRTLPLSLFRLFWPAGLIALLILIRWGGPGRWRIAAGSLLWMSLALLPYSFLTYQARVPSRHTYLAAAGLAILLAAAIHSLALRAPRRAARLAPALLTLLLIANLANLWLRKLPQFERRAEATERFIRFAAANPGPVAIGNVPFPLSAYQHAVAVRFGRPVDSVRYAKADLNPNESLYSDEIHP
jgi:hypothetical protein